MILWIKNLIISKYTGSIVRHVMTALGGYLVAQGVSEPAIVEQFVTSGSEVLIGVIVLLSGQLMSFAEKGSRDANKE